MKRNQPTTLAKTVIADLWSGKPLPTAPSVTDLRRAVEWLFQTQDAIDSDGSAATYNLVLGWGDPYPETTGYLISTLYDCRRYFNNTGHKALASECERRAERMADWVLDRQLPDGGFPAGTGTENTEPSVFNTGQILLGLCAHYRETSDTSDLHESINRACEWLITVQNENGTWDDNDYNEVAHAYSSRISWPMLLCHQTVGLDNEVEKSARRNLDWVIDQQNDNGWFQNAGFTPESTPFLHTIAYTVRGLLESGLLLDEERYLKSAEKTGAKLASLQSEEGFLQGEYDENWNGANYHCLTGNAQMCIVWSRLLDQTSKDEYKQALKTATETLCGRQTTSDDASIDGSIKGSDPVWGSYMFFRYPNWATKFYVDALLEYERHFGLDEADCIGVETTKSQ